MRLGAGGFGSVFYGNNGRIGQCAVKIFDPTKPTAVAKFEREVEALTRLKDSDRVVHLHDSWTRVGVEDESRPGTATARPAMAMEFINGFELYDYIINAGASRLAGPVGRSIFVEMLLALNDCHSVGVAHRDLKPDNFMVDHSVNPPGQPKPLFKIKLIDFNCAFVGEAQARGEAPRGVAGAVAPPGAGVSAEDEDGKMADEDEVAAAGEAEGGAGAASWTHTANFGGENYRPPEFFKANPAYDPFKADVWIMGVVFLNLFTGLPPFNSARRGDVQFDRMVAGNWGAFWAHLNGESQRYFRQDVPLTDADKAFAQFLLRPATGDRPSLAEVMGHPWMSQPRASAVEYQHTMSRHMAVVHRANEQRRQQELRKLARFIRSRPARQVAHFGRVTARSVTANHQRTPVALRTDALVAERFFLLCSEQEMDKVMTDALKEAGCESVSVETNMGESAESMNSLEVTFPAPGAAEGQDNSVTCSVMVFQAPPGEIRRLQRAIVDGGGEDAAEVGAIDLKAHKSDLFEVLWLRGEGGEGVPVLDLIRRTAQTVRDRAEAALLSQGGEEAAGEA